jgi:hypothetical protein
MQKETVKKGIKEHNVQKILNTLTTRNVKKEEIKKTQT